jgi:hypothetical protein
VCAALLHNCGCFFSRIPNSVPPPPSPQRHRGFVVVVAVAQMNFGAAVSQVRASFVCHPPVSKEEDRCCNTVQDAEQIE